MSDRSSLNSGSQTAAAQPAAELRVPAPAAAGAPTDAGPGRRVNPHLHHVREHLERIRNGMTHVARAEDVFLGPCDDEAFWELIGFRLAGHPSLILGAVRFPRLERPGLEHGRESLASFLSAPSLGRADLSAPPGAFPVLLPRGHETLPRFLKGLRSGRRSRPLYLESVQLEFAFDLRLSSPAAVDVMRRRVAPLRVHLFRTARGHVLRGQAHGPLDGPNRRQRFLSVCDVEQLTPQGRYRLPALVLNRSFVTMSADVADRETHLAAAHWVPFALGSANPSHLLAS